MENMKSILLAVFCAGVLVSCDDERPDFKEHEVVPPPVATSEFAGGADISSVTEFESKGVRFYNKDGVETECTALMRQLGMNAIRLRVWVNPKDGFCDKSDVIAKAKRARALGMRLLIDFHYSDTWADPGTQKVPELWKDYDITGLAQALRDHTVDVLQGLKSNGIDVEWVQVGNETTSGMVWPEGRLMWDSCRSESFGRYAELSNAGYDAVKRVYPDATVIVHHDNGQYDTTWFYDELLQHGGKFDMIGLSLYPDHERWKKDIDNAAAYAKSMSRHFDVPVMIVETGYSNVDEVRAEKVMKELMARMVGVVSGVFYWKPEICGGWDHTYWDGFWHTSPCVFGKKVVNNGAFTEKGEPSAALRALTRTASVADTSGMIHDMRD